MSDNAQEEKFSRRLGDCDEKPKDLWRRPFTQCSAGHNVVADIWLLLSKSMCIVLGLHITGFFNNYYLFSILQLLFCCCVSNRWKDKSVLSEIRFMSDLKYQSVKEGIQNPEAQTNYCAACLYRNKLFGADLLAWTSFLEIPRIHLKEKPKWRHVGVGVWLRSGVLQSVCESWDWLCAPPPLPSSFSFMTAAAPVA